MIIICLPTPIRKDTKPDLSVIEKIVKKLKNISKGQLILESTTYPGTTKEIIGKKLSRFKIGENIFLAYSPERRIWR